MARAWAIKLGSGGRCVPFCEKHGIVGVGWGNLDVAMLSGGKRDQLRDALKKSYGNDARALGSAVGQLWRFARECSIGDYVIYYDPPQKRVQVAKVTSELKRRDFEPTVNIDVWLYREVKLATAPIAIVDFYGALKGAVLGPRMSFWELRGQAATVEQLFLGNPVGPWVAPDPQILASYQTLRDLVLARTKLLDASDWERLAADYFREQGARVEEEHIGGSMAVIDFEARFDRGELGTELWRVQVKHLKHPVDWAAIEKDYDNSGDCDRFAYVSVAGFTTDAMEKADEKGDIVLLEAQDFTRFLLSGRFRSALQAKLKLPFGATV